MSVASTALHQVAPAWHLFTRLGEAQILLPAMAAALLWLVLVARTPRMAAWWLGGTAAAALLTTATKVAFFGYELGYAPWNYAGISGHATFAAAVLPVLVSLLAGGTSPLWRRAAVLGGYLLAAGVAYSRLPVGAHSAVEVVAGFVLGAMVSGLALWAPAPVVRPPIWLMVALLIWVLSLPAGAPPSPMHGWVIRLSLALSDRAEPYSRRAMHRDYQRALKRQRAAQASSQALSDWR